MFKVGIDARLYSQTGIGVYIRNLLHFLRQINSEDFLFYVYLMSNDYSVVQFKDSRFVKRLAPYHWHSLAEQIGFLTTLYQDKLDLMHFTYFSYPVLYKKRFITTLHDVTPLKFKTGKASTKNSLFYEIKFQTFKFVIAQQIVNSIKIITPTETVKRELLEIYGKSLATKTTSIYEGVNYELTDIAEKDRRMRRFNKEFLLYVGNFYPHKNVEKLIEAFSQVKADIQLILVGPDDFFAKRLLHSIIKLKQAERIIFYHNPSREDMIFFYKKARGLVHPSLSEGFGLPIVEAIYFHLPIIASDIPVFKELLDNSYISFNPKDSNDIRLKIEESLTRKGKKNYKSILQKYSYKKMAQETYFVYKEVLK